MIRSAKLSELFYSTSEISHCAGFNKRNRFYKKWVLIRENIHEDIFRITKRKINLIILIQT